VFIDRNGQTAIRVEHVNFYKPVGF
jgi:hypothetical protein